MLDKESYRQSWEWKLEWYDQNGFTLGENLFTTAGRRVGRARPDGHHDRSRRRSTRSCSARWSYACCCAAVGAGGRRGGDSSCAEIARVHAREGSREFVRARPTTNPRDSVNRLVAARSLGDHCCRASVSQGPKSGTRWPLAGVRIATPSIERSRRQSSLTDCGRGRGGQGGGAGGAAQDDLADRERSARQRRRLGLQDVRARDALLPLHLGEPDRLPERAGAKGGKPGLRLRGPQRRRGRTRTAGNGRREGLLHPPQRALRERPRAGAPRREPQRDAREGLPRHRRLRGRHGERGRHQGSVRRPRRQLEQARTDGGQAQREARQAARRDRRPRPRLRRQHDRRLRRRLRVPA